MYKKKHYRIYDKFIFPFFNNLHILNFFVDMYKKLIRKNKLCSPHFLYRNINFVLEIILLVLLNILIHYSFYARTTLNLLL